MNAIHSFGGMNNNKKPADKAAGFFYLKKSAI